VELELGLRMSPGRYWLGVAIAKGCGSDMNDEGGDNDDDDDDNGDLRW
jgi:hypothetical protein